MDIKKHLIIVKNEDKTAQIKSCKFFQGRYFVNFDNSHKEYSYRVEDINWYRDPKYFNGSNYIIYDNNQPVSNIESIFDFGDHIRLCFKSGYTKIYPSSQLHIEETSLSSKNANNCFEYLKELSGHVSVTVDGQKSLLKYQYDKLTSIVFLFDKYHFQNPLSHRRFQLPGSN